MDNATIKNFQQSLKNMRAKVVAAKGEEVKGLSPVIALDNKTQATPAKTRGAKE